MLADMAMDSAQLARDRVFKVQVNDVHIRLKMLMNSGQSGTLTPSTVSAARTSMSCLQYSVSSMSKTIPLMAPPI